MEAALWLAIFMPHITRRSFGRKLCCASFTLLSYPLGALSIMAEIKVNKPEAARRQIDVAIKLLFNNEDPIPIHTLAMAAFRIVRDLAKDNPDHHMDSMFNKMIRPGMEKEFWSVMHRPANFFKHADLDADDILNDVKEEINDVILFLATLWYQELGYKFTPEMLSLVTWFTVLHPHFLQDNASFKTAINRTEFAFLKNETRVSQLETGKILIEIAKKKMYGT